MVLLTAALVVASSTTLLAADTWPQAAGPNNNWQVEGTPPVSWSVTRNENIRWRTPLPEAGQSGVTIWRDRVFVTTHVPIKTLEEKEAVTDIFGFCLDANTGEVLWKVMLPGTAFISLAGGFTDGTVFAPITDGEHVWFFNRCGSMGCYDMTGKQVWLRQWKPRFKHNNRQAEPYLVGDVILYVEVANKELGAKIQKWTAPGVKSAGTAAPAGVDEEEVWTYLHGIDKRTGKVLWRENVGTVVHNTPTVGVTSDGKLAVAHARGGPHQPLEKPAGQSLTSLAPGEEGKTLWSTALQGYDPSFACHWNKQYVFGFRDGKHLVLDARSGKLLREQPLYTNATVYKHDARTGARTDRSDLSKGSPTGRASIAGEALSISPPGTGHWTKHAGVAVRAGKGHPNTNQANIVIGDWHWFLSHNVHYLGRVHIETGAVEYLELPAQLMPSTASQAEDVYLWGKGNPKNLPLNARGFAVGDKGNRGTGWGHISAASPTLVGPYLFLPVVTGTVYVIDTRAEALTPEAIVAVNDLGPGGETWTLATLTYASKRLYAHTMKEIICIEAGDTAASSKE
ncbi:MAG: PQQ-binding-like beta-propeller repeat protein [Planctomycetales bacterium]|nr:PQQ-binding-like beta-propeller repeat protein [Planctomycetales bacterium]